MTFPYFIYLLGGATFAYMVASGTFRIVDKLEGKKK